MVGRVAPARPVQRRGPSQVLHYYSSRWHGSHGLMYDFARDAAGVAPPGCTLPVLVQYARVEEYRYALDAAKGRQAAVGLGQHWTHDGAVSDVRRTWQRWIAAREDGPVPPGELRDLNYLAHAACYAGTTDISAAVLGMMGRRATPLRGRTRGCGEADREVAEGSWGAGLTDPIRRAVPPVGPGRRPLGFDAAELPDQEGDDPGDEEEADDDEADDVEVEARDPVPEEAVEVELLGEQAQQFDRADDQGDGDGEAGDREVVVDLADRLEKAQP